MIIKEYIESKIAEARQEISADQQGMIATETKFIKDTKQSLESLFALIGNTRKDLSE